MTTPTQSPQAPAVPDGWVLVPREPTEAMLHVALCPDGGRAMLLRDTTRLRREYAAMLAAAPPAPLAANVDDEERAENFRRGWEAGVASADVGALRELLARATPGEIKAVQSTNACWEVKYENWRRNHYIHDADMAALFVAIVNAAPAILTELDAARARIAELEAWANGPNGVKWYIGEADAARKDAQRYRWLRNAHGNHSMWHVRDGDGRIVGQQPEEVDAAIDAAMARDGVA